MYANKVCTLTGQLARCAVQWQAVWIAIQMDAYNATLFSVSFSTPLSGSASVHTDSSSTLWLCVRNAQQLAAWIAHPKQPVHNATLIFHCKVMYASRSAVMEFYLPWNVMTTIP